MSMNVQLGGTQAADISGKDKQKVWTELLNSAVWIKQPLNTLKTQQANQRFQVCWINLNVALWEF